MRENVDELIDANVVDVAELLLERAVKVRGERGTVEVETRQVLEAVAFLILEFVERTLVRIRLKERLDDELLCRFRDEIEKVNGRGDVELTGAVSVRVSRLARRIIDRVHFSVSQIQLDLFIPRENVLALDVNHPDARNPRDKRLERIETARYRLGLGQLVQIEAIVEFAPDARVRVDQLLELFVHNAQVEYRLDREHVDYFQKYLDG